MASTSPLPLDERLCVETAMVAGEPTGRFQFCVRPYEPSDLYRGVVHRIGRRRNVGPSRCSAREVILGDRAAGLGIGARQVSPIDVKIAVRIDKHLLGNGRMRRGAATVKLVMPRFTPVPRSRW